MIDYRSLERLEVIVRGRWIGVLERRAKGSECRYDDGHWGLSPVYDIVSTLPYQKQILVAETMALALADETKGGFTVGDFVEFSVGLGMPEKAVAKTLKRIGSGVPKWAPTIPTKGLGPHKI